MSSRESLNAALAAARLMGLLLVRRRKILFLGLLAILPALLPVLVAALRGPLGNKGPSGLELYALIAEFGYLATLVPLGAILLGTSLMGDELESGTATYLLTRSTPRSALVAGKFLAYCAVMAAVFFPALALTFASVIATSPGKVDPAAAASLVARTSGVIGLAIVTYGALTGLLGTITQRPVILSAVFVFGWEPMTRIVPGYVDFLTLKKHLLALWPTLLMSDRLGGGVEVSRRVIKVGTTEALLVLAGVTITLAVLTTLTLRQREFVRGQTLG